jgi:hypothetical protein
MAILHAHFGYKKPIGGFSMFVGPIMNHVILDQQSTLFKLTMLNHCQDAMSSQNDVNMTTRLWERIVPSGNLNQKFTKWFKMAKLCNVLMLGNVEDECTFSNLAFIKTKL